MRRQISNTYRKAAAVQNTFGRLEKKIAIAYLFAAAIKLAAAIIMEKNKK